MFNVINNLNPNAPAYDAFPNDPEQRKVEFNRRTQIIKSFVKDLGLRAGVDLAKIEALKVGPYENFFGTAAIKQAQELVGMRVPILLYIDFVKDFQVQNFEELYQKLEDLEWTQTVVDRVDQIINGSEHTIVNEYIRKEIQSYVQKIMNEPEKMFDAFRFGILHAWGHIQNEHLHHQEDLPFLPLYKIALLCTLLVFFPVMGIGALISTASLPLIISFFTAVATTTVAMVILVPKFAKRAQLATADRFAVDAFPGAEGERIRQGGIYFFESVNPLQDTNEPSCFMRLFSSQLSNKERIEMLQNYQPAIPDNPQHAMV